ncbi:MAG: hypothetical protein Kow0090_03820 [Myxococcota bacterium]
MIPKHLADYLARERIPFSATIELTTRCNWECIHCFAIHTKSSAPELSTEEIETALDELRLLGCFFLCFTGGEATLRKDLIELVEYASMKGLAVSVYSNGSLITEEMARRLKEAKVIEFQATILGAKAETHDAITGRVGSFAAAWRGIEHLRKAGVNVFLKTPVMKQNFGEIDEIRKLVEERGFNYMCSPMIYPRWRGDEEIKKIRLDDSQMEELIGKEILWMREEEERIVGGCPINADEGRDTCKAGATALTIAADGSVMPCQGFPVSGGNIRDKSLTEIWLDGGLFVELRRLYAKAAVVSKAKKSEEWSFCCPQLSYLETERLDSPSEESERYNRAVAKALKKLSL